MSQFEEYRPTPPEAGNRPARNRLIEGTDYVIRQAEPGDIENLARLAHEREGKPLAFYRTSFQREIEVASGEHLLLTAHTGEQVIGYGRVRRFTQPADAPQNCAPSGWYLHGVIVAPSFRRRGVGTELTRQRLLWLRGRAECAYYFANANNRVSIEMHRAFHAREITRNFTFPNVEFEGGEGILFRMDLPPESEFTDTR